MTVMRRLVLSNVLCGGLVLGTGVWCGAVAASEAKPAAPAASARPSVEVRTVVRRPVASSGRIVGTLQAPQTVTFQPQVQGYLEKVCFDEGTVVKKGDLLFEIDARAYKAALAKARADVQSAEASVLRYQKDVDRYAPLVKSNAVSQQDLDHAQASLLEAQASLAAAEAAVASAQLNLDWCQIRAPFSGLMGKRLVDVGNLVSPTLTPKLATLYQMDPIRADFSISELQYLQNLDDFAAGQTGMDTDKARQTLGEAKISLLFADKRVYPLEGKFSYLDPAVDAATGTVACRAEFPNPSLLLRPGQFVQVQITGKKTLDVIAVPQRAVFELQNLKQVYVVGADGKAQLRNVVLGDAVGAGETAVAEGLKDGDRVVVEGWMKLRPGMAVEATEWAGPASASPAAK